MGAHSKCHIMVIFMWNMTINHWILEHPTLAPSLIEVSVDVVVSDSPMADAFSQSSSIVAATVLDSEDESQETELDSDAAEWLAEWWRNIWGRLKVTPNSRWSSIVPYEHRDFGVSWGRPILRQTHYK